MIDQLFNYYNIFNIIDSTVWNVNRAINANNTRMILIKIQCVHRGFFMLLGHFINLRFKLGNEYKENIL